MALSNREKAVEVVRGAGQGAVVNGALAGGVYGVARAVPRLAPVLGVGMRALPVVGGLVVAGGAAVGGYRAYQRGDSVLLGALKGSLGIMSASAETMDEAQARLGTKFGGSPNDIKLAAENSRRGMKNAKTVRERDAQERRALALEREYERVTGQHIGPTEPTSPPSSPAAVPPAQVGLVDRAKQILFGDPKPKPEDALSKQRRQLEGRASEVRGRMEAEFKQGGPGPKYKRLQDELSGIEKDLGGVTRQQEGKREEEAAAWRSVGALGAGIFVGGALGRMTQGAASRATSAAESGIEKLATRAAALVKSAPKGVISGTVAGDKAAAAVSAANAAASRGTVSRIEAFGLPALNVGHGVAAYAYSAYDKDNPAMPILRAEGTAAIAAGAVGFKFGMAAYAMRPLVSPTARHQLDAVANRLSREARSGPAAVAQARGRRLAANASAAAGVAQAKGQAAIGVAQARGQARVATTRIDAGARVGEAKANGASRVAVAEAKGKLAVTRQIKRGEVGPYKDTWQDSKGRVYHRKDMSVRKGRKSVGSVPGAVNDNSSGRSNISQVGS